MSSGSRALVTLKRLVRNLVENGQIESEGPSLIIIYPRNIEQRFLDENCDLKTRTFYLVNESCFRHVWKVYLTTDTAYDLVKSDSKRFWRVNLWSYRKTLDENSIVSERFTDQSCIRQINIILENLVYRIATKVDDIVRYTKQYKRDPDYDRLFEAQQKVLRARLNEDKKSLPGSSAQEPTRYEHGLLRSSTAPHYCMYKVENDHNVPYSAVYNSPRFYRKKYDTEVTELPEKTGKTVRRKATSKRRSSSENTD